MENPEVPIGHINTQTKKKHLRAVAPTATE